jgi:group I intron endonuclease
MGIDTITRMIYTIYKLTNTVNRKVYIGYTSLNPEKRFAQHRQYAFNTNHKGKLLYKAILKHGVESFVFEVIYQSRDREHALDMETHFITEFRAWVDFPDAHGYNLTMGGRQALKSQATRDAQAAKLRGRTQTAEHKAKKGFSSTNQPAVHPFLGKKLSAETCAKKSVRMKALYASGFVHPNLGKTQTEENKEATRQANKKTYHIIDNAGNRYVTKDLKGFTSERGIVEAVLRNYSRRGDSMKGYFIEYTIDSKGQKTIYGQK